jgi:hypothetical protein
VGGGKRKWLKSKQKPNPIVETYRQSSQLNIPHIKKSYELVLAQTKERKRGTSFPKHTVEILKGHNEYTEKGMANSNTRYLEEVKKYKQSKKLLSRIKKALTPSEVSREVWREMFGIKPKPKPNSSTEYPIEYYVPSRPHPSWFSDVENNTTLY